MSSVPGMRSILLALAAVPALLAQDDGSAERLFLGAAYLTEIKQSFDQARQYPHATLFGPGGPHLAPLARQALEDLKP